jgi:hypothetical protein
LGEEGEADAKIAILTCAAYVQSLYEKKYTFLYSEKCLMFEVKEKRVLLK